MIKINVRAFMLIVMAALTGVTVAAVIAAIAWLAFDLVRQVNSPIIIFVAMTAARGAFSAGDRMLFRLRKEAKGKGRANTQPISMAVVWIAYFFASVTVGILIISAVRLGVNVVHHI